MTKPRPWSNIAIPKQLARIPAQLGWEERQYLLWLATSEYRGDGALVELGTLLGGSSSCLAEGLRRSKRGSHKVIAMDHFVWAGDEFRPENTADGDDFLPHYMRNVEPYRDLLDVRRVDLHRATWDEGPIEILFVDAAKSWALLNRTLQVFGPHLMPGRSRVVFQDFRFLAYWIQLVMDARPDLWQQVEETERAFTVTFCPRNDEALRWCAEADFGDDDFPWSAAQKSFAARIAGASPENADRYRFAAMVKALVDCEFEACRELCAQVLPSDRREQGIRKAAARGSGLLLERLQANGGAWRKGLTADRLARLQRDADGLPDAFREPLAPVRALFA